MSDRREEWADEHFIGWPPMIGVYQPSPLPAEFRRENKDLRIPRKEEDLDEMEKVENLMLFRPFF